MLFDVIQSLLAGQHVDPKDLLARVFAVLFVIFCILPLHEFAHGWTAKKLGDPTAKLEGRLTFNPIASVDPMGSLCLILFGFGWAKPVPVDSRYFKKPKRGMAITALAGPLSNLLAALVGAFLYVGLYVFAPFLFSGVVEFLLNMFSYYVMVNISLAVFNLIPMPPLDGSRILAAFLSDRAMYTYYRYQQIFVMLLFVLMLSGALSGPLGAVQRFFTNTILTVAQFPFKLAGAL